MWLAVLWPSAALHRVPVAVIATAGRHPAVLALAHRIVPLLLQALAKPSLVGHALRVEGSILGELRQVSEGGAFEAFLHTSWCLLFDVVASESVRAGRATGKPFVARSVVAVPGRVEGESGVAFFAPHSLVHYFPIALFRLLS